MTTTPTKTNAAPVAHAAPPTTKQEDMEKLRERARSLPWDPEELRAFLADLVTVVASP